MSALACYRQSTITAGLQSVARGCGVIRFSAMREHVIQIVEKYIDAVRSNDASELPLHPDVVCEFPTNTYRGAASFRQGLDQFALIMKSIDVIRLVVDGEHCVAIVKLTRSSASSLSPSIFTCLMERSYQSAVIVTLAHAERREHLGLISSLLGWCPHSGPARAAFPRLPSILLPCVQGTPKALHDLQVSGISGEILLLLDVDPHRSCRGLRFQPDHRQTAYPPGSPTPRIALRPCCHFLWLARLLYPAVRTGPHPERPHSQNARLVRGRPRGHHYRPWHLHRPHYGALYLHLQHHSLTDSNIGVPLFDIICFAVTFTLSMLWRNRPEFHRRLILLASAALSAAGWARFPLLPPAPSTSGSMFSFSLASPATSLSAVAPTRSMSTVSLPFSLARSCLSQWRPFSPTPSSDLCNYSSVRRNRLSNPLARKTVRFNRSRTRLPRDSKYIGLMA